MLKRIALSLFALLCVAGRVGADPIILPGGGIVIKFQNMEQINAFNLAAVPGYADAPGTQGNWGVFVVSSMSPGVPSASPPNPPHDDINGAGNFYSDDGPNGSAGMITGLFYGIQFNLLDPTRQTATGGTLDLYWHDAGKDTTLGATLADEVNCLAAIGCDPNATTVGNFTTTNGGIFLARLQFATGIAPGQPWTVTSNSTPTTNNATGHTDGYLNVDTTKVGAWTAQLNQDWFFTDANGNGTRGEAGETRDVRLTTDFTVNNNTWDGANGTEGAFSHDPARAFAAVPEPATLVLLGVGLAGLAARRRKKIA